MLNRIVLTGRLTRDPELRRTTTDIAVASFTIAVDDSLKGPNGEKTTSFIPVVVWNAQADSVAKALRKGSLVGVDGRIRQRSWERRDGTKATTLEVIANQVEFLEPKGKRDIPNEDFGYEAADSANAEETATEQANDESKNLDSFDVVDDDIPF